MVNYCVEILENVVCGAINLLCVTQRGVLILILPSLICPYNVIQFNSIKYIIQNKHLNQHFSNTVCTNTEQCNLGDGGI